MKIFYWYKSAYNTFVSTYFASTTTTVIFVAIHELFLSSPIQCCENNFGTKGHSVIKLYGPDGCDLAHSTVEKITGSPPKTAVICKTVALEIFTFFWNFDFFENFTFVVKMVLRFRRKKWIKYAMPSFCICYI